MTTTRRILLSATSMLASAGAGLAAGHTQTVSAATVRHDVGDDERRTERRDDGDDDRDVDRDDRAGRECDDDERDERCTPQTTRPRTTTTRPRGTTSVVTVPVTRPPRPGTTSPGSTTATTRPAPPTGTTRPPVTTAPATTLPPTTTPPTTAPPTTPVTTTPVSTTTATTMPAPGGSPTIRATFDNLTASTRATVPAADSPERGLVARFTLTNPAASAQPVSVALTASTPAGFPRYLEAADFSGGGLTCVTGTGAAYYKTVVADATFTCTGTMKANATAAITVSSGSLIATSAVGQTVTLAAVVDPGGDNRTLQGTFVAAGTPPTTVPPTTTLPPPSTTTTSAPPPTTTTLPPPTSTTTTVPATTTTTTLAPPTTVPPTTTTTLPQPTTAPPTTAPPTTVPPTTVPPTTVPPTTTTTVATNPTVGGSLVNVKAGTRIATSSPDNPDRGFVSLVTVSNPTAAAKVVTVRIDGTTTATGFPRYLEAADFETGAFSCVNPSNSNYYKASTATATFTCTGTLAANASSVITLSSGSMIAASAAGQNVTVVATATPGGATRTLQGTFN